MIFRDSGGYLVELNALQVGQGQFALLRADGTPILTPSPAGDVFKLVTQEDIDAVNNGVDPLIAEANSFLVGQGLEPTAFMPQIGDKLIFTRPDGLGLYNLGNGVMIYVPKGDARFIAAPQNTGHSFGSGAFAAESIREAHGGLAVLAAPFAVLAGAAAVAAVGAGGATAGAGTVGVDASTGLFAGESATAGTATLGADAAAGSSATVAGAAGSSTAGGGTVSTAGAASAGAGAVAAEQAAANTGSAAASAAQTASNVSGPITQSVGDASSVGFGSLSDVAGSIHDTVQELKDTIGPIFADLQDSVHSVTSIYNDINNNLIQPIVTPIKDVLTVYQNLQQTLTRDLHSGIKGLLDLPTALGNAFNNVDASLSRSMRMLTAGNAGIAQSVIAPALVGKDGRTAGDLNATLMGILAPTGGEFSPPPTFNLEDGPSLDAFKEYARKSQEDLSGDGTLAGMLFRYLFQFAGALEGTLAQREPYVELWREELRRAAPIKKLEGNSIGELYKRGELSEEQALEEMLVQGISAERGKALLSLVRQMPDAARVVKWYAARWLDNVEAQKMLRAVGFVEGDIELMLNSSYTELGASDLMELLRRGDISRNEAQGALERQGYRQLDSSQLIGLSARLLGMQDLITSVDRFTLRAGGAGSSSLSAQAPEELRGAAQRLGLSPEQTDVLYANHWQLLPPALAVQSMFRGFINPQQLGAMLDAAAIPRELQQDFIDLQRPLLPYRSVGTLIHAGVISDVEAANILRKHGFDDPTANKIIKLAHATAKPAQAAAAAHVHGLTQTTVLQLFDAGTIDQDHASSMLANIGWSGDAISATLSLHAARSMHAERIAEVELIIARVKAGQLDEDSALAQLQQIDLTQAELVKAQAKLTTAITQQTKLPSESQIVAMVKKTILTEQEGIDALSLIGFSEYWAEKLILLGESSNAHPSKP